MRHPEDHELLRYADGELPAREARRVKAHLESCWTCRSAFHDLQRTVDDCVRYRKDVLEPLLPPPPEPWPDIYRGFADIDATPGNTSLRDVIAGALQFPVRHLRAMGAAAVAAAVVFGIYYQFHEAPSVHAAQLLQKAVAAADARPQAPRRIRIRTSRRQSVRVVGSAALSLQPPDSLATLFAAANYSWDDPLSARSFQAWHDQLPEKRDEVATLDDGYRIRTSTASGELLVATLKLRAPDLRPVHERLEFRNREWVEITEEPGAALPEPAAVAAAPPAPAAPASPGGGAPAQSVSATLGDELQVIAALHHVGADLGDPVEVTRSGNRVVVSGVGIAPQRQRQIQAALDALPRVVVRFSEPAAAPEQPAAAEPAPETPPRPEVSKFQLQLERQAGGRAQYERLSAQLLDLSDGMMSRAFALRHLARRFAPEAEARLDPEQRRLLRQMALEHVAALAGSGSELNTVFHAPAAPPAASTGAWQDAAEELFRSARRVERSLAALLGGAAGDVPASELPAQLTGGLAQLHARAAVCERLLGDAGR